MRWLTLLLVACLLPAASTLAGAGVIPFQQAYVGATYWHISDWDMGTLYTGNLTNGDPVELNHAYTSAELDKIGPVGGQPREDAWGIFRVESIYNAKVDYGATDTITIGSTSLYDYGAVGQTVEIVGMFHGRVDDQIVFQKDVVTGKVYQTILSKGDTIDLYTQAKGTLDAIGTWDNGVLGPSARLAADKYPGIGYDGAGNLIGDLALTGHVQLGFQADGVVSTFYPAVGANTGSGTFGLYISWDGGSQLPLWDTKTFPIGYVLPGGETADMRFQGTITPTGLPMADPWLAHTSDPATGSVTPEPATMVLVALGGLGVLFGRKRK